MKADLGFEFDFEKTEYFMPTYGNFKSGSTNGEPDVSKGDLVAYQFIKAPLFPEDAPNQDEVYKDTGRTVESAPRSDDVGRTVCPLHQRLPPDGSCKIYFASRLKTRKRTGRHYLLQAVRYAGRS